MKRKLNKYTHNLTLSIIGTFPSVFVMFSLGKGVEGTGFSKNLHNGSQPSFTLKINLKRFIVSIKQWLNASWEKADNMKI